jgi:hypothetical protein
LRHCIVLRPSQNHFALLGGLRRTVSCVLLNASRRHRSKETVDFHKRGITARAVTHQPASDHHTGAPDATPAVHVDGASCLHVGVNRVEHANHVRVLAHTHILDRQRFVIDLNLLPTTEQRHVLHVWREAACVVREIYEHAHAGVNESLQLSGDLSVSRLRYSVSTC